MILYKKMYQVCLLICTLFIHTAVAQPRINEKTNGVIISGKSGTSFLVTEINRDLSGTVNEFNNLPGLYNGMEVSRFLSSALETGAGVSYSFLRGRTETPDFSAIGYQYFMQEPLSGAMQYSSRLYGPEVFARYHFGRNVQMPGSFNFFMKAGAGILFYSSELFYSDNSEVMFGKNRGNFENQKMSSMVYVLGGGLNYALSELICLKIAANMNMVGYDFLDMVHNFDAAGNRQNMLGVFGDLSAGIAISLNREERTTSQSRSKKFANRYLPFSPL